MGEVPVLEFAMQITPRGCGEPIRAAGIESSLHLWTGAHFHSWEGASVPPHLFRSCKSQHLQVGLEATGRADVGTEGPAQQLLLGTAPTLLPPSFNSKPLMCSFTPPTGSRARPGTRSAVAGAEGRTQTLTASHTSSPTARHQNLLQKGCSTGGSPRASGFPSRLSPAASPFCKRSPAELCTRSALLLLQWRLKASVTPEQGNPTSSWHSLR